MLLKSNNRRTPFVSAIARKGANHMRLAERVAEQTELLPEILWGLGADQPRIK